MTTRLLALLIVLVLSTATAEAGGPYLVASASAGSSTGNNVTTTGVTTTGATLLVAVVTSAQGVAAPTPTDSQTNTWAGLTAQAVGSNSRCQIWYVANPSVGAAHTVTVSTTGGAPSVTFMAFAGIVTSSPFDQENGATTSGSIGSQSTGSVTPSEDGELIVIGLSSNTQAGGGAFVVSSPYAVAGQIPLVGGQHFANFAGYAIQGTATATSATWSWVDTTNANPCAVIASFKATPSAGGGEHSHVFAQ